jgi:hypothetical protein
MIGWVLEVVTVETMLYDPAATALQHKRTASKYYREGRKWARNAKSWAQAARNSEIAAAKLRRVGEEEDAAFYDKQVATWDRLAANAAKWSEESRKQARFYRGMQRRYEARAAA